MMSEKLLFHDLTPVDDIHAFGQRMECLAQCGLLAYQATVDTVNVMRFLTRNIAEHILHASGDIFTK